MLKRILLTLALAGSVMTSIAACNNSNPGGTTSSTAPLASTSTESSAPLPSTGTESSAPSPSGS